MGVPRSPTLKEVKNPPRPPILFMARRRGALLIMPRPLSGCQIKSKTKGFLLRYRLFLYYQRFFQNIEKDWRKIFEKDYFRDFLKMMKFTKKNISKPFQYSEETNASTETKDTSAESP
jgi:hypothetical protein